MAKNRIPASSTVPDADVPVVGPRQPCPCGSGRRYKACHGRAAARAETALVVRPFEGLASECDLVAMATLVPAATTRVRLNDDPDRPVTLATVLPMVWPALHRSDGAIMAGLQLKGSSGDVSRDVAAAIEEARSLPPGSPVLDTSRPGPGPRLQDLIVDEELDITIHEGFDYWVDAGTEAGSNFTPEITAAIERANESITPTQRLSATPAAYWCRLGNREYLRWVLPHPEDDVLDAFARMQENGRLHLGPGTKYAGSFRALGCVVPVWELAPGDTADEVEQPVADLGEALTEALAAHEPLTNEQRRLRAGIVGRQLTVR